MKRDQAIFDLIGKEENRQKTGIELIASENFTSKQVMEAAGSVLTNKYAEGLGSVTTVVAKWWIRLSSWQ